MPELKKTFNHPEYDELAPFIKYWELAFQGGHAFKNGVDEGNDPILPRYEHETEKQHQVRVSATPVINVAAQYARQRRDDVFGGKILRPAVDQDAPDPLLAAWMDDVTSTGAPMSKFMAMRLLNALTGRFCWLGLDAPSEGAPKALSLGEQIEDRSKRPRAVWASPLNVPDWDMDGDTVTRAVIHYKRIQKTSFREKHVETEYWHEWFPDHWLKHELDGKEIKTSRHENSFGFVPWFRWEPLLGEGYVERFADIQKALLQTISHMRAEEIAVCFTQLVFLGVSSEQVSGTEAGSGEALCLPGDGSKIPDVKTISGDASVMQELRANLKALLDEASRRSELSEKSASNAMRAQSGVSKAYDVKDLGSLLCTLAESTEIAENRLIDMFGRAMDMSPEKRADIATTSYPREFDLLTQDARLERLTELAADPDATDEVVREAMRERITMLFPRDTPERQVMLKSVEKLTRSAGRRALSMRSRSLLPQREPAFGEPSLERSAA